MVSHFMIKRNYCTASLQDKYYNKIVNKMTQVQEKSCQ